MLDNLNTWEFFALLLLALLIFGEKLPKVIQDGLAMLRNLRKMASNATSDLSRELGTDIAIEDLNPKNFVRKHLLSEEDEATLRRPLQGLYDDIRKDVQDIKAQTEINLAETASNTPSSSTAKASAAKAISFDDAT